MILVFYVIINVQILLNRAKRLNKISFSLHFKIHVELAKSFAMMNDLIFVFDDARYAI